MRVDKYQTGLSLAIWAWIAGKRRITISATVTRLMRPMQADASNPSDSSDSGDLSDVRDPSDPSNASDANDSARGKRRDLGSSGVS